MKIRQRRIRTDGSSLEAEGHHAIDIPGLGGVTMLEHEGLGRADSFPV